jgi:thioredoxin reductase (NADPH)
MYDIIIIGAGPAGLSASLRAKELGLNYLCIEKSEIANTIKTYPPGKPVSYYPANVDVLGDLELPAGTTEDVISGWQEFARREALNIHESEEVESIECGDNFNVTTNKGEYEARFVLLSIGVQGTPRKVPIDCKNEDSLCYELRKPGEFKGKNVIVVGGGDTAIESAILLKNAGANVTLSYRKSEFFRLKEVNQKAIAESGIPLIFNSNVLSLNQIKKIAVMDVNGEREEIPAETVFIFAGTIPPTDFLEKIGLKIENNKAMYSAEYESSVPGIFVAGDLTKEPLIKPAINHGYKIVETVAKRLGKA